MSVALSSSDQDVIERTISNDDNGGDYGDINDVEEVFELDRCCKWIREGGYKSVALQFPDGLLRHAPEVALKMEEILGQRMSILGDTSYGECCVDEVAAEHVCADAVVHFGHACMTPTERLPVLFVFTVAAVDVQTMVDSLRRERGEASGKTFIFYDVRFHKAMTDGKEALPEDMILCPPVEPDSSNAQIKCGRLCAADPPPGEDDAAVYVGRRQSYQLLLAVTFAKCSSCLSYDPKTSEITDLRRSSARELARRHYLVEKAKDAERIGVLVGTLGASRYRDVVDQTLASIRRRGKRAYVFLVGKPNVPKLANFPEVDLFVLVACPENSLVTSREYLRPVVTPYELDLALNPAREWTGEFEADFASILPGRDKFVPFPKDIEDSGDVSLLTGRIREMRPAGRDGSEAGVSSALLPQETGLSVLHEGGGGEFLGQRSWRGLEQKLGQTEVTKAVAGQSGVAMGYQGEGQESSEK